MKSTPGPWRIAPSYFVGRIDITDTDGKKIAMCCQGWSSSEKEMEANARLISAAPELLTALKMCAAVLSGEAMSRSTLVHALEAARDVLKKVGDDPA